MKEAINKFKKDEARFVKLYNKLLTMKIARGYKISYSDYKIEITRNSLYEDQCIWSKEQREALELKLEKEDKKMEIKFGYRDPYHIVFHIGKKYNNIVFKVVSIKIPKKFIIRD